MRSLVFQPEIVQFENDTEKKSSSTGSLKLAENISLPFCVTPWKGEGRELGNKSPAGRAAGVSDDRNDQIRK